MEDKATHYIYLAGVILLNPMNYNHDYKSNVTIAAQICESSQSLPGKISVLLQKTEPIPSPMARPGTCG